MRFHNLQGAAPDTWVSDKVNRHVVQVIAGPANKGTITSRLNFPRSKATKTLTETALFRGNDLI